MTEAETNNEIEDESIMLTIELKLYEKIAEAYIKEAQLRDVDESIIVAKIIEVVALNEGMINALLNNEDDE